ncbi:MAG: PqqD family protein [Magnetococcales bacterium]|nr:PqqD family protein [Magnetococcales bacterium]
MSHPILPASPQRIENNRLGDLAVSPNGFAFDPRSGQSFTLNATGLIALEMLQSGASLEETAHKLAQLCGVAEEIALGAVEGFTRQLARSLP